MGKMTPAKMIPMIVTTFTAVTQYSISPYRLTLKLLKPKMTTKITATQISELTVGSQILMILADATS
jgi:hypothetical protein